jgi:hypothetical protein
MRTRRRDLDSVSFDGFRYVHRVDFLSRRLMAF